MAATTNVQVIIDAKDNASKVLKSFGNTASQTAKGFEADFRGAGMAAAGFLGIIAGGIGFGVKIASDLETARQGFKALLGSAKDADAIIEKIKKDAKTTPFQMAGLVQANLALTQVTKNATRSEEMLLNVGKALAMSGGGQAELDRVIYNLQQIGNTGKITEMDIRQFGYANINVLELLADYYGTTKDAAGEMVKDSKDAFGDLEKAFEKAGTGAGKNARAYIEQAGTFKQLMSNVVDNLEIMSADIVTKSGIFDLLKGAMGRLNATFEVLTPNIIKFIDVIKNNQIFLMAFAGVVGGLLISAFIGFMTLLGVAMPTLGAFVAAGFAMGVAIGVILQAFGGAENIMKAFGDAFTYIKGTVTPLIDVFQYLVTRLGQILKGMGISGEFGTIINTFQTITTKVDWYSQRLVTIVGETWQKIKNFLAFGGTSGDATIVQALEGIWNRIKPIKEALEPLFEKMGAQLALTGQIIQTQVVPAWNAFIEVLGPFWAAIKPEVLEALKNFLMGIAIAIGAIVSVILAVITGIASGLANALPFIAQAIEGIIQFFRGLVQFVTGIITGDWAMALEGMKQMAAGAVDFVINVFGALLKFISGFIQGVIAFFRGLYNALIGHSIIPEMCDAIMSYFTNMKNKIIATVKNLVDLVVSSFEWMRSKVEEVIGFIRNLIDNFKPKIEIGLTLPNIEGAWNDLKIRARNMGIPFATGGVVPGPIGAPVLATVHGGEVISPNGRSSGSESGGSVFNVYVGMYAGTETEKRNIARDLYSALVQVATSQNKTVQELLGG